MAQTVAFKLGGTLEILTEPVGACFVTLRYGNFIVTAKGDDMSYTLAADMQVNVQVSYVDAHGNPAKIDGDVSWASSDENLIAVIVDTADSTKALVRSGGNIGQAQVTATADADLGTGVRELITIMDVEVVAGEAVAGTIMPVGAPEPAPHVEPRR